MVELTAAPRQHRDGETAAQPVLGDRFWSKVEKTPTCWLWTAGVGSHQYGQFHYEGKSRLAHRLTYESLVGPIPEGLHIDHLCRVRRCVNPAHMEPVTCQINLLRGETIYAAHAAKTHCPQGHPYDDENTYRYPNSRSRGCRECNRQRCRVYYNSHKVAA